MVTTKHLITYARCLDANIKDIIEIAAIFKLVYTMTDVESLYLVHKIINNQKT